MLGSMEEANYLVKRPDGHWKDTRYQFGPGDKRRILQGPHKDRLATVTTLGAQMDVDGVMVTVACYHTALVADGRWVTVRWNAVELADNSTPDISEEEEFFENHAREAEALAEEEWLVADPYSADLPWEHLPVEDLTEQTAQSRSAGRRRRRS